MVPLSKSGVRKHRGFESRPLRHRPSGPMASRRSRLSSAASVAGTLSRGRGRLVDYGAALEMRFGATRRGFESRPLRQSVLPTVTTGLASDTVRRRSALDSRSRARRGTSGALYLQSAIAGLNSHLRSPFSRAAASSDVEDRVPRSGESRTVSGPEGSSTKRTSPGAAERPGPSRSSGRERGRSRSTVGARQLHSGNLDRTGAS